jgi:tight adherence protein B
MLLYTLITFLVVTGVVVAAYMALVVLPENREQDVVRKRLKSDKRTKITQEGGLLKEVQRLSKVPVVDQVLGSFGGITHPLQLKIHQAGLNISVAGLILMCGAVFFVVTLLVNFFVHVYWIGLAAGAAASPIPIWVVSYLRKRRLLKFEEQFPEAIDLIARALRAGHALTTGLSMAAEESPQPVGGEFRLLYEQQNFGLPLPDALRAFARRIPVLDAQFFATAVLTQRESGGNLSEVLDNLGSVIRERFRVKRQVRVISAHGRLTGWILTALPPGLAAAFMVVNPDHVKMLLNDNLGHWMIGGAVIAQVLGGYIISRIVKIEY